MHLHMLICVYIYIYTYIYIYMYIYTCVCGHMYISITYLHSYHVLMIEGLPVAEVFSLQFVEVLERGCTAQSPACRVHNHHHSDYLSEVRNQFGSQCRHKHRDTMDKEHQTRSLNSATCTKMIQMSYVVMCRADLARHTEISRRRRCTHCTLASPLEDDAVSRWGISWGAQHLISISLVKRRSASLPCVVRKRVYKKISSIQTALRSDHRAGKIDKIILIYRI